LETNPGPFTTHIFHLRPSANNHHFTLPSRTGVLAARTVSEATFAPHCVFLVAGEGLRWVAAEFLTSDHHLTHSFLSSSLYSLPYKKSA